MKFKNSLIFSVLLLTVLTVSVSTVMGTAHAEPTTLDMTAIDLEAGTIDITVTDDGDGDDITVLDVTEITIWDTNGASGSGFTLTIDSSSDVTADPSLLTTVTIGETDLYNIKDQLNLGSSQFNLVIGIGGITTDDTTTGPNGSELFSSADRTPTPDSSPPTVTNADLVLNTSPPTLELTFSEGVDVPTVTDINIDGTSGVPLTGATLLSSGANGDTVFTFDIGVIDLYNLNFDDTVANTFDFTIALTRDGVDTTTTNTDNQGLNTDTDDNVAPTLTTSVLELNTIPGTLQLTFNEGVEIPEVTDIIINGDTNYALTADSSITGSDGDTTFTITLGNLDKYLVNKGDSIVDTITFTAALTDDGTNSIVGATPTLDTDNDDSLAPTLTTSVLELNTIPGTLQLTFNEGVNIPTITDITVGGISGYKLTSDSSILAGTEGSNTYTIQIGVLDKYELNDDDDTTDTISFTAALTDDGGVDIVGATPTLGTDNDDTTLPTLDQIDLDLDAATLVLTFSEGVDIPTESAITIDGTGNVPLTTSSSGGSNGDTTFTITLSAIDQYNISVDNPIGTVDYATALTTDGTNIIAAVDDDTLDTNDPDISAPTLDAGDSILDLNSNPGTLTLFFSEGVDVPEPTAITLIGSSNVPLTGGTVLESAGDTQFTIQLNEIDRYNISADHSGSVDFNIAEALTQNGADIVIAANTETLDTKTLDTTAPTLDTTTLDLNAVPPTLTLTFNEGVDIPTVTDITIDGTADVPLTGVSTITTGTAGSVTFIITLGDLDHYNISANDDDSDQIIFTGALTVDGADVPIVGATQALAQTPDTTRPTFTARRTSATSIEVTFSEFVDSNGGDGTGWSLSDSGVVDLQSDPAGTSDIVTLTISGIPDTSIEPTLTYSNAGSVVDGATNEVNNGDNTTALDHAPPTFTVLRTAVNTFEVTVSENVSGTTTDSFSVAAGGVTTNTAPTSSDSITLTTTDLTLTSGTPAVTYTPGDIVDDSAQLNALDAGPVNAVDGAPPTFTADRTSLNSITLTFSEDITSSGPDSNSFTVAGATTVEAAGQAGGNTIILTTTELSSTSDTPLVTYNQLEGNVQDQATVANLLTNGESANAADSVAPTFTALRTDLNEITLTFSEDITSTGGETDNFTVAGGAGTVTAGAQLGGDTIILTTTTLTSTSTTHLVTYVQANGDVADQSASGVVPLNDGANTVAADGVSPTFTADRTALNTIVLEFSEAVDGTATAGSFTVDGADPDATITDPAGGTTLTITTTGLTETDGTPLVEYVAATGDIADVSAQTNEIANDESANADDSVAPTFTAERTELNTIVLSFSEPITAVTDPDTNSFTVTSPTATPVSAAVTDTDEITLTTTGLLLTDGTPQVDYVLALGNVFDQSSSGAVPLADGGAVLASDSVTPTFTVDRSGINTFDVTFSEPVTASAIPNSFTVVDGGTVTNSASVGGTLTIELTTTDFTSTDTSQTPLVTYNAGVGTIEDVSPDTNEVADSESATATDSVSPTFTAVRTGINEITLEFSEDITSVGGTDAFTVDVGGSVTHLGTGGPASQIILTTTDFTSTDTSQTPLVTYDEGVGDVADVSPNTNEVADGESATASDKVAPEMISAVTTSTNTVEVTFSEDIHDGTLFDVGDFTVGASATLSAEAVGSVVTLTVNGDFGTGNTPSVTLGGTGVNDLFGNTLPTAGPIPTVDNAPPTFTAQRTDVNTIILTFSEDITPVTPVDIDSFTVTTPTATTVSAEKTDTDEITLTISGLDDDTDGTPTVAYSATNGDVLDDSPQNNEVADGEDAVAADNVLPVITLNLPTDGTTLNEDEAVDFTFSEQMSSATIVFTRTGGELDGVIHTYNLLGGELASGNRAILISTLNTDATFITGGALVDGAIYDITMDGADDWGMPNEADEVTVNNITFDTSAPEFTAVTPLDNSFNNNAATVGYTLDEDLASGNIEFTSTLGSDLGTVYTYPIGTTLASELLSGSHTITFAEINAGFAGNLVSGSQYTISFNGLDEAGNQAAGVIRTVVTYDTTLPTFTPVGPGSASENNNVDTVDFDLSEVIGSGTLTFTSTSGSDIGSVYTYTFTGAELTTLTPQSITFGAIDAGLTGGKLVDGSLYTIQYDATDLAGNDSGILQATNVKYDVTAPVITPVSISSDGISTLWAKDSDTITVTVTGNEALYAVSETINGLSVDDITGDGTNTLEFTRDVVTGEDPEAAAFFSLTVRDEAGNTAPVITIVTDGTSVTVDTTEPAVSGATAGITVGGNTELTLTDEYTDSCTATDDPHADPSCDVQDGSDTIDTTVLGAQTVTYEATDLAGNVGLRVISTTVVDTNPATITAVTVASDSTFDTAYAIVDDIVTVSITGDEVLTVIGSPTINGQTATIDTNDATTVVLTRIVDGSDSEGAVTFAITVQDPGANQVPRTEANLTDGAVTVDTTAPTFNVDVATVDYLADFDTNLTVNVDTYVVGTIEGQDDGIGSGIASSVIDGDTLVDESTADTYPVTYTVTDKAGNTLVITETVIVGIGDIPVIALNGAAAINVEVQSLYTELGATATDTEDDLAAIPLVVSIGGDVVDTGAAAGTKFTVEYDVTDSSGNDAVQVTREVTIVDTQAPEITILGNNPETVALNTVYTDAGATATDIDDGPIVITDIVSTVNTDTLGFYTVTYNVVDSQGNPAVPKVRNVEVTLGNAPVVTVTGGDITFKLGATYNEQGATCEDVEDGTLTITQTGSIDQLFIGEQTTTYTCTDSSGNITEETRTVTILPKGGGGKDNPKSAPTSGLDWNTNNQIVDNGIVVNGKPYQISDNWHTDFVLQTTAPGSANNFSVKTYAQNGGIWIQEIAFGVPGIGQYHDAEALIEVYYNYDKTIDEVRVIQDTEVVDESALVVSTSQVNCRADSDAQCYQTNFKVTFREPLQDDVFAIKAIDMKRRSMMPTYLNDGLLVDGESLNPAKTLSIPGPQKYEGLIEVTQSEKYSNLWFAADGRIFEMFGESDSFRLVSQEKLQRVDTGNVDNRLHSGYGDYKVALAEEYKKIFDSSEIQKLVPESFSYDFPDVDSRTQFLMDNGLLDFVRN